MERLLGALKNLVPQVKRVKNEIVFYVGLVGTLLLELEVVLNDADVTDLNSWQALVPAVTALVARAFNTGPETAAGL